MLVGLSDAAWIVKRHPRVVQRRLLLPVGDPGHLPGHKPHGDKGAWLIDTDNLKKFYALDTGRLAEIQETQRRSPAVMSATIASLEARLRLVEDRLRAVERRTRTEGQAETTYKPSAWLSEGASASVEGTPDSWDTYTPVAPLSASNGATPRAQDGAFRDPSDAAKWLSLHGPSKDTARRWSDLPWQEDRAALLRCMLEHKAKDGTRARWPLRQCGDLGCPCRELLS